MQYKRKLRDWNCTRRRKSKISKSVEMWFNAIGSTSSHEGAVITSFHIWYEKAASPFLTYLLTGRRPYLFPFIQLPFLISSSFLLGYNYPEFSSFIPWTKFQLVLPTNFAAYRPNLLALDFSPNDPIGSRSNGGHLESSSINNRRISHSIHSAF